MTKKIRIFPYKFNSKSAKLLSKGLEALRIKPTYSNYIPKTTDLIINWGSTTIPRYLRGTILNSNSSVALAINKLKTFQKFSEFEISCPEYCTDTETATQWTKEGHKVYGRLTVTGSQGKGIIIFKEGDEIPVCPLYTKKTKTNQEYRVHVINKKIIDFVQKKKRSNVEGGTRGIRNHTNGWIFAREGVTLPTTIAEAALHALEALGLDFGAVDIGYNSSNETAFVYEINTAPGLEGTTLTKYIQNFKQEYTNG